MTRSKGSSKQNPTKKTVASERDREAVLGDFRKIAGPLRGRNRPPKPKS